MIFIFVFSFIRRRSANNGIFRVKTERAIYLFYLIIELNNLYNLYIYTLYYNKYHGKYS